MLRSRGAGTRQIVGMALIEGLLLTVPAVVLAPWLAPWPPCGLFDVVGPLAAIGLSIAPSVTADAYVAAAVAAGICLVALTLPGVLASRSLAGRHDAGARRRPGVGQRLGIDIALLAIAGLGLWQLRLYGAPLTRSVQGTIGLDPLLVAAPGDRPAGGCDLRAPDHPARRPAPRASHDSAAAGSSRRWAPASSPGVPCATRARRCC